MKLFVVLLALTAVCAIAEEKKKETKDRHAEQWPKWEIKEKDEKWESKDKKDEKWEPKDKKDEKWEPKDKKDEKWEPKDKKEEKKENWELKDRYAEQWENQEKNIEKKDDKKEEEKYTDKWDNMDVEGVMKNKRLMNAYSKCVLDQGKCTPEGKELKSHISESLQNGCKKCTRAQRHAMRRVIKHYKDNEPETWKQMLDKYDPERKYQKKYEKEMKAL